MAGSHPQTVLEPRVLTALFNWLAALTAALIWPSCVLVLLCLSEAVLVGFHFVENLTAEDQAKRLYTFVAATMDLNIAYLHLVVGVPLAMAAANASANGASDWDTVVTSAVLILLSVFTWIYAGLSSKSILRNGRAAPVPCAASAVPDRTQAEACLFETVAEPA